MIQGLSERITFKVDKYGNFSEWYNRIIREADLIDDRYNVKGFIVHKPWSMIAFKVIYSLFEEILEEKGHKPVLFPTVIPEDYLAREAEHVEGFKAEVFWVTHGSDEPLEKRLALRPTSETAFYPMYSLWIRSVSDLPLKLYQSCTVFRYETKATKPLLRGREFLWIEAHDAFSSEEEAYRQVHEDMEIGTRVLWEKLGLPFLFFERPQWDKFRGAEKTFAVDCLMPDGRSCQLASTHYLGQRFAKAFDVKFQDSYGSIRYVYQTCYGPGVWRILAALISIHGDDDGLIFPFQAAPTQIVIIPIISKASDREDLMKYCLSICGELKKEGLRVEVDSAEKTPGYKYYRWEMLGVPIRLEIGSKELKEYSVTVFRRDTRERVTVSSKDLSQTILSISQSMLETLKNEASDFLETHIRKASNIEGVKEILEKNKNQIGFIGVPFCSLDVDGAGCGEKLKDNYGLDVKGLDLTEKEKPKEDERCIVCLRKAGVYVYLAESY